MEEAQMHHDEARRAVAEFTERIEGVPGLPGRIAESKPNSFVSG